MIKPLESKILVEGPVQAMHAAKKQIRLRKFQRVIFERQIRVSPCLLFGSYNMAYIIWAILSITSLL